MPSPPEPRNMACRPLTNRCGTCSRPASSTTKPRWRMPPMPTTSNCACRASLPPATFRRMPCSLRATATRLWLQKHERRAAKRAFLIWKEGQNSRWSKWGVIFWPVSEDCTKLDSTSGDHPRVATWVAQYEQSVVQRGDVEHMVQPSADQNLAHKV